MTFAVEALLPREIKDQWGEVGTLADTHLRYEIKIVVEQDGDRPRIRIADELLRNVRREDSLKRLNGLTSADFVEHFVERSSRKQPYINTEGQRVVLHQDGHGGRKREYHAKEAISSVLSAANSVTFRHAFAFRQELAGNSFPSRARALAKPEPHCSFRNPRVVASRPGRGQPPGCSLAPAVGESLAPRRGGSGFSSCRPGPYRRRRTRGQGTAATRRGGHVRARGTLPS